MTPRKVPSDEQLRSAISEVGDALQRALVLSSERIQSVLEDAVVRGRMTRRDAEDLASKLGSLGRDQAAELRDEFDQLVTSLPTVLADVADAVDPRGKKRRKSKKKATSEAPKAAPVKKAASASKPKPAPAPTAAKSVHVAEPVKQGAGPVPSTTSAKKPAAKKSAAKQAPAKKAAAKKPAASAKAAATKTAAKKPAAKKPAAKKATTQKLATKPKPAPAPTTATKPHVAEPVKQGAGPTPSPAPNAATSSARELIAAIPKLTKTELSELRTQEAAAKNRSSVIAAIDKALA